MGSPRGDRGDNTAGITRGVVGTPLYTPPELVKGTGYNEKVDIYSLGVILCELFNPFCTGMERVHVLQELHSGTIPKDLKASYPDVASLVDSMMVHDHLQRPSARDLLETVTRMENDLMEKKAEALIEEKAAKLLEQREAAAAAAAAAAVDAEAEAPLTFADSATASGNGGKDRKKKSKRKGHV